MPPELIGLRPGQHAERDIPGLEQFDARLAGNHFAVRRQNRRHIDQILLLDIRVAQRVFECGEGVTMHTHAFGQEHPELDLETSHRP